MKLLTFALASLVALSGLPVSLLIATSAQAQDRGLYQSGPGGTPPFAYGDPYGNLYGQRSAPAPAYEPPALPSLPQVPRIESYIPVPSGPTNYPCTMPGCR